MSLYRIGVPTFGSDGGMSGVSRYVCCLLSALAQLEEGQPEKGPRFSYQVVVGRRERGLVLPSSSCIETVAMEDMWTRPVPNLLWHQFILPLMARKHRWDLVFLPAANRRMPLIPRLMPCPIVGTVHDLAGLHMKGKYDLLRMLYIGKVVPRSIKGLDRTLTVSWSSARDIVFRSHIRPDLLRVTHLAAFQKPGNAGQEVRSERRCDARNSLGLEKPYILYVSRIEHPGKNHVGLIRAFDLLKATSGIPHLLVFVGSDREQAHEVHQEARKSRYCHDIHFLGLVSDGTLDTLYQGADLLVFPSLYEGFGLPVLEAMARGVPVLASCRGSLPEVVGDVSNPMDPLDTEAMAWAMESLLVSPKARTRIALRGKRRAGRFSWEATALLTRKVFVEALGAGF